MATAIIIAVLTIATIGSSTAALTMWSPGFIPSLIVHGVLVMTFSPLLSAMARIPFGINSMSSSFRLGRLHLLIAIFAVFAFFSGTGLPWIASHLNLPFSGEFWSQGLDLRNIPTWYGQLFQYLMSTPVFWQYFLPVLALQTIFDWALFIYRDFMVLFKDLGLGGSGTTFYGWAVGRMRFYAANASVLTPPRVPQTASPWRGRLNVLPQRQGPRPTILGCTPQRQVDFPAPPNTTLAIERLYDEFVTAPGTTGQDQITVSRSYLEPGLLALRRTIQVPTNDRGGPLDLRTVRLNSSDAYGGEIFHAHRCGTAHVILHPDDCRRVIQSGWGERHPFCASGIRMSLFKLYYNWFRGVNLPVPEYLIITYAPRHEGDYAVLREIMRAAVWNATEGRLYSVDANTYPIPPAPPAPEDVKSSVDLWGC